MSPWAGSETMPWWAIEEAREADRAVISLARRDVVVEPVAAAVRIAEVVLMWCAKSMLAGMWNS